MSEAIFVEGLTKAYGGKTVVDHLGFTVQSGMVFGLLGAHHALDPVLRYAGGRRGKGYQAGQRHRVDPLFPDAHLFRHDAAGRGHAARDAEDRQLLPADAGDHDDEKRLSRRWCGKRPDAGVRDARPHGAVRRPFRPLFPLGITPAI